MGGWGVFYGHDSNSVDLRCEWRETENLYDCPGGTIPWGGTWAADSSRLGTGGDAVGNPDANSAWGGGAGCHFNINEHVIDQLNQYDSDGRNLVQDPHSLRAEHGLHAHRLSRRPGHLLGEQPQGHDQHAELALLELGFRKLGPDPGDLLWTQCP